MLSQEKLITSRKETSFLISIASAVACRYKDTVNNNDVTRLVERWEKKIWKKSAALETEIRTFPWYPVARCQELGGFAPYTVKCYMIFQFYMRRENVLLIHEMYRKTHNKNLHKRRHFLNYFQLFFSDFQKPLQQSYNLTIW